MCKQSLKHQKITAFSALCFFVLSTIMCLVPTAVFADVGDFRAYDAEFIRYDDEVKAQVYISKRRVCEKDGVRLTAALYSGGVLADLHSEIVDFADETDREVNLSFTSKNAIQADSVKVFLFDNTNLSPVCNILSDKIRDSKINISVNDLIRVGSGYVKYCGIDGEEQRANLDSDCKCIVNGAEAFEKAEDVFDNVTSLGYDGYIVMTDDDRNRKYDKIDITTYADYIVDEVGKNKLTASGIICAYDDNSDVEFYDKNGGRIDLSDFEAGDVISVSSENYKINSPKPKDGYKTKIYNLGKSCVTGTVTEVDEGEQTVRIDGKLYGVNNNIRLAHDKGFTLLSAGTYYIGITGKVFYLDDSKSMNIGYILDASTTDEEFESKLAIRMLTADGSIKDYTTYNKFDYSFCVNGNTEKSTIYNNESQEILKFERYYKRYSELTADQRLVEYKIASDGSIKSVSAFDDVRTLTGENYKKSTQSIGSVYLNDDAVVFAVNDDDAFVTSVANLTNGGIYDICAAAKNNNEYGALVITSTNIENPNPEQPDKGEVRYGLITDSAVTDGAFDIYVINKIFDTDGTVKTVRSSLKGFNYKTLPDGENNYIAGESFVQMKKYTDFYKASGSLENTQRYVEYKLTADGAFLYTNACTGAESFSGTYNKAAGTIGGKTIADTAFVYSLQDDCTAGCDALIDGYEYSGVVFNGDGGTYKNVFVQNGELSQEHIPQPVVSEYQYGYIEDVTIRSTAFDDILAVRMLTDNGIVTLFSGDCLRINGRRIAAVKALENVDVRRPLKFNTCEGRLYSINTFEDEKHYANETYNARAGKIGTCLTDDNTVIYMALDDRKSSKHYKTDISQLIDGSDYDCTAADFGDDGAAGILVVTKASDTVGAAQNTAIAVSTRYAVYNGDEVFEVTAYKDNSNTPVKLIFGDVSESIGKYTYEDIRSGSPILYSVRSNGVVGDYAVLGIGQYDRIDFDNNVLAKLSYNGYYYVYGYINEIKRTSKFKILSLLNSNEDFAVTADSNKYTFKAGAKGYVLYTNEFDAAANVDEYDPDTHKANFVFMKICNDDVQDICTFDERTDLNYAGRAEYVNTKNMYVDDGSAAKPAEPKNY